MSYFKSKPLRRVFIVGVLLLVVFEMISFVSRSYVMQNMEAELSRKSFAVENKIEKIFLNVFTITDAYQSFIEEDLSATKEETEHFLQHLMIHEENYVRNIAYVEGTIIKYNYPYEENSSSIGVDLSLVEGQREVIMEMEETLESSFIGPVNLVQGGTAFILRVPVVDDGVYVGHISTVIDADLLLNVITEQAISFNIGIEIGYPSETPFISIGEVDENLNVVNIIENDYADWEMIVHQTPNEILLNVAIYYVRIVGFIVTIIVCYYVYTNVKLNNEVNYKAHHDSLTSDFNRLKFIEDFNQGLLTNKLIAFTDINKFKVLNDTLGHHFGDWGLQEVSKSFNDLNAFTIYRNSGDEFILVSNHPMTKEEFITVINTLNLSFYNEELKRDIDISLSVGVIEHITENLSLEDMLIYLDYAMYDAKKQNKTMTIVTDQLMEVYKEQKYVEQLLIEDIKGNNLITFYQPIINIKEERVEAIEVLSRWIYEDKVIPAARFIDVAKKIRYIETIDQNLFDNLQSEYLKFKDHLKDVSKLGFAINLSAETLKLFEQDFASFHNFIGNNKIPKENIVFEISEDINLGIISNQTIENIKNAGYNIVIDDFGSGVSKLTDVLSGKLYAIKTDKGMLPEGLSDTKRLQGFNTIIKAINATGSRVIVEGVETSEQLKIVEDSGCTILQGYYFARPMKFEDVVVFIETFDYTKYIQ